MNFIRSLTSLSLFSSAKTTYLSGCFNKHSTYGSQNYEYAVLHIIENITRNSRITIDELFVPCKNRNQGYVCYHVSYFQNPVSQCWRF